jgi:probable HAF family extracellular repeat protein
MRRHTLALIADGLLAALPDAIRAATPPLTGSCMPRHPRGTRAGLRRLAALAACPGLAAAATLALPDQGPAQAAAASYPYILVDPGTFGGPSSFFDLPAVPLTSQGGLLGTADTAIPDADYPNVSFSDPLLEHSFEWKDGHLTDLGALPGNNSSAVFEVNGSGTGVGVSETAVTDPYTGGASINAVMFKNGRVINLGTLPGGYESQANDINDLGQVSGFASNGIPDQYSLSPVFPWGTQARSFIWQNGVMRDIGTLGGPDAVSVTMNARGQITGYSYTNSAANPATGIPTVDPFLWQNGHMRDLGTLGGTFGMPNWLNNAGDVAGTSDLAGDQTNHPFLWNGSKMIDLGTLGGANGSASWVSDAGDVAGSADLAAGHHHAFLWQSGHMRDLSPVDGAPCSNGNAVNNPGDVVGNIADCHGDELAAVLWSHGRGYDLNALIAPSALHLVTAQYISDQGEIVGGGVLPNGDQRVFLLIRNPSVPLPTVPPSAGKAPHVSTARIGPALDGNCARLPAALAARLVTCDPKQ